jgi:hypothetical protein
MTPSIQSQDSPIYTGRKTKTGNSEALRFEQALFRSHPEFSDRVVAQVIAPGCMLVLAESPEDAAEGETDDPLIEAFLAFVEKEMPQHLMEIEPQLFDRLDALVGHVQVDPDEDLAEESLL